MLGLGLPILIILDHAGLVLISTWLLEDSNGAGIIQGPSGVEKLLEERDLPCADVFSHDLLPPCVRVLEIVMK